MNSSLCHSLDDYLAHDLTGDGLAAFVAHLGTCPDCRRAVDENERLSALLTEATAAVPTELASQVERRLRVARRRRVVVAAAALAATVAVVWLFGRNVPRPSDPAPTVVQAKPDVSVPLEPAPADRVRVTFPADAHVFAVPIATESPNVTVLWVLPDLRAAGRPSSTRNKPISSNERQEP